MCLQACLPSWTKVMKRMSTVPMRFCKCPYLRGNHEGHLANTVHETRRFVHEKAVIDNCFFQLIPAMNPATVAGIGPLLGPFWPDSHQTEDGRAHIEGKLSIRQVERTVEEDSVIQNFRITAAETKCLGEWDAKARSRKTIRKSRMVQLFDGIERNFSKSRGDGRLGQ